MRLTIPVPFPRLSNTKREGTAISIMGRIHAEARLFAPVSALPLAYLRVMFGLIMLWEVWRYFDHGWIARYYITPRFFFTYYGFDWIQPWPGDGMYLHFIVMGVLAALIALGLAYRLVMPLFFLAFTYVFLLDQANYLNHFYLISLISLLMCFIPANARLSIDALVRPGIRRINTPSWPLLMLRLQLGLVYFFGALAKLNGDWLHGEPMRTWLADRTDFPLIGGYFDQEWMVAAFVYGGIAIDLCAIPMLMWRRTRWLAAVALISFHVLNSQLFSIGIFPWFMIATLPLFFPVAWWSRQRGATAHDSENDNAKGTPTLPSTRSVRPVLPRHRAVIMAALAVYFTWQCLMPLRHILYPGNVSWTEEGHKFSWHMKLNSKQGVAHFRVYNPKTDYTWHVTPRDWLTSRQHDKMTQTPDMILMFAHMLADEWRRDGYPEVQVYANVEMSFNGRPYQPLIDPTIDLAAVPRTPFMAASWILPLTEP